MINKILESSRALLASAPRKEIYFYFDELIAHVKENYPNSTLPSVIIVYSLNKLCETFKYGQNSYIIYDQYLGQSFNKFNRLIFHENKVEARSYLCKLVGEEYYLNNDIENCVSHLLSYHVNSKAVASELPKDFILKKSELIIVQESFVLFHEFAHNLINANPDLILKAKEFIQNNKSAKQIINIIEKYQSEIKKVIDFTHFYEELSCDIIALELTYSYFTKKKVFNRINIIEGISLAFLYLRTLIDVKLKASGKYLISKDIYHQFTKLRYNLIRHYYQDSQLIELDKDNYPLLIELYEKWEEKIDMEIVLFLDDDFKNKMSNILQKSKVSIDIKLAKELLKLAD